MPKRNELLPYLKIDASGRLTYRRQIPERLRPFLGNKTSIRRTLDTTATDCADTRVLNAYAGVHAEVEALLNRAEAQASAITPATSGEITAVSGQTQLSKREVAGIAGEILLQLRSGVEHQQEMQPEVELVLLTLEKKRRLQGNASISAAELGMMAAPLLSSLGITPTPADLEAIGMALVRYVPVIAADMEKLQSFDFSEPKLKAIAPPMPKIKATWAQMLEAWERSTGGVLETDGYGVSRTRKSRYDVAIREIQQVLPGISPDDLDIAAARRYIQWMQDISPLAIGTAQARLKCFKHLFKVGKASGLVSANPFEELSIKTPAGANEALTYQSFSKQELIKIFKHLKPSASTDDWLMCWILLTTGCRINECLQLRTFDLKQTKKGVWFFDWKHEPTAPLPMLLKSKDKNNRQCPMHVRLIEEGVLDLLKTRDGRLFPNARHPSSTAHWMAARLREIDIYEKRKKTLHSFRNAFKDICREAGIAVDVRQAFTGHTSAELGEREYGIGLAQMPDKLSEYMNRVDLSWLNN